MKRFRVNPEIHTHRLVAGDDTFEAGEVYEVSDKRWSELSEIQVTASRPVRVPAFIEEEQGSDEEPTSSQEDD